MSAREHLDGMLEDAYRQHRDRWTAAEWGAWFDAYLRVAEMIRRHWPRPITFADSAAGWRVSQPPPAKEGA